MPTQTPSAKSHLHYPEDNDCQEPQHEWQHQPQYGTTADGPAALQAQGTADGVIYKVSSRPALGCKRQCRSSQTHQQANR